MLAAWVHSLVLALTMQSSPPHRSVEDAIRVGQAPHGCLNQQRLAHHVAAWLGGTPIDARIRIDVRGEPMRRDVAYFRVLRGREIVVERAFEPLPPDCESTHAALGLAIAIAVESTVLDAFIGDETPEVGRSREGQARGAVAAGPTDATDRKGTGDRPGLEGIGLRIGGVSAFGLHPLVGFGGQLLAELRFPRLLTLRLGGVATRGLRADVGAGGAVLSWVTARTDVCLGGQVGLTRLDGCVGAMFGPAIATGFDFDVTSTAVTPWVGLLSGFSLTVPASRPIALALDMDLVVPVVRPDLVITVRDDDEIAARRRLPPVGGMLSVGLVIQFPAIAR